MNSKRSLTDTLRSPSFVLSFLLKKGMSLTTGLVDAQAAAAAAATVLDHGPRAARSSFFSANSIARPNKRNGQRPNASVTIYTGDRCNRPFNCGSTDPRRRPPLDYDVGRRLRSAHVAA